jgi:hypothetical protein
MSESRTDFVPLAACRLVKPNGSTRAFGLGASSAALRGAALVSANTAASSGDVLTTTADAYTLASNLGKNGVHLHLPPGCALNRSAAASASVFRDGGSEISCTIGGYGRLSSASAPSGEGAVVDFRGGGTLALRCESIEATSEFEATAVALACTARLEFGRYIKSTAYDALYLSGGGGIVTGGDIIGGSGIADWNGNGIEFDGGDWTVRAASIQGGGDSAIQVGAGGGNALRIQGPTRITSVSSGNSVPVIWTFGGVLECFSCQITGWCDLDTMTSVLFDNCTIDSSAKAAATINLKQNVTTLRNCTLVMKASETYAITAATAKTLYVDGTLTITDETGADRTSAIHSNVTVVRRGKAADSAKLAGTTPTAAGLALLDDADNTAQRTTLGVEKRLIVLFPFAPTADVATGDGKAYFRVPTMLNGGVITAVHAMVNTAGTTGDTTIQIARVRSGTPADVLSTPMAINSGETGSDTGTAGTINTSNDDLATGDILRVDVDGVSTTEPLGLQVTIEVTL